MTEKYETYHINIAGVERDLRLFEVKSGVRIALLNILGDIEFVNTVAKEMAKKLSGLDFDATVTAEAKSIPLAHALGSETGKPYVVLRKTYKPYMGDAIRTETVSITTGTPQMLYLDEKDLELVKDKRVILVDDVISTGSTLKGMRQIVEKAGSEVVAEAAIFTEGDEAKWQDIISLGHLPIWVDS